MEAFHKFHALDPKVPVIFITAMNSSDAAIQAMTLGAYDFMLKPLAVDALRKLVGQALEVRRLMSVPVSVPGGATVDDRADSMVGNSPAMQDVYKAIGRVAPQNVTVLIRGESGTGKELVARAIYHYSPRAEKPFLAVNCAAIPDALLESELFGHERGAFTGADQRRDRQIRTVQRRHAVSRRNRRHVAAAAGQDAAGACSSSNSNASAAIRPSPPTCG